MLDFICPIKGNNVRLTSPFGWRTHPVTGKRNSWHQGVDLAITPNTNVDILASADGVVTRAGVLGTYGYVVIIRHNINGKRMDTTYAHLKAGSIRVKVGQHVKQGQVVGIMGSSGSSTAPHLHFEIHNGAWATGQPNAVDPMKYIDLNESAIHIKKGNENEMEFYRPISKEKYYMRIESGGTQDLLVEKAIKILGYQNDWLTLHNENKLEEGDYNALAYELAVYYAKQDK